MTFKTAGSGVCAREIDFEVRDGLVHGVKFHGGCPGFTQALSRTVEGMPVDEAIRRLRGIVCRGGTSCADQLAKALSKSV